MHGSLFAMQVLRIESTQFGEWDSDSGWGGQFNLHGLLPCMPRLQALHLASCKFESLEGVDFSANSGLRFLDVRCNLLQGWHAQGTSSLGRLSALCLGGNSFESEQQVQSLASHFSALTSLQSLSFSDAEAGTMWPDRNEGEGNSLRDTGAAVLAQHLSALVCLTLLELRSCMIGDAGICDLASSLHTVSSLRALNVENNLFGAEGLRGLAQGLPCCPTLRTLALALQDQGMVADELRSFQGAAALAQVFGACWHLSEMCLRLLGFDIPEQCLPVVFSALGHITALKRLEMVCDLSLIHI